MVTRTSFGFSPSGGYAVCLRRDDPSAAWQVERWTLGPERTSPTLVLRDVAVHSSRTQAIAVDDGRVLVCQPSDPGNPRADEPGEGGVPRTQQLVLAAPAEPRRDTPVPVPALRLVRAPDSGVLALTSDAAGWSTLWRVDLDALTLTPLLAAEGLFSGGFWLEPGGPRLGLTRSVRGRVGAVVADLRAGAVDPMWPDRPGLRLLLSHPESGLLVIADGHHRVGWTTMAEPTRLRWPAALNGPHRAVPLAIDPTGARVVSRIELGARSGLRLFTTDSGEWVDLPVPDGVIGGVAAWNEIGLYVPFAGPEHRAGIARVGIAPASFDCLRDGGSARGFDEPNATDAVGPRQEHFSGAAGAIEAVVYGNWRTATNVAIALHGGPDAAWSVAPDALLGELAHADVAVIAVNPRGSRGYSRDMEAAIRGAWGGPDLADIRAVAQHVIETRKRRLLLLGGSYGAYLGLLALAADPRWWSRAVIVAPFTSGQRLHQQASPRVRALLTRLGGRKPYTDDELGARDTLALADRITADVLLIHGANDPIIPVAHSRDLHAELQKGTSRTEYLELPAAGHDPLSGPGSAFVRRRVIAFLTGDAEPATAGIPQSPAREHHPSPDKERR